MPALFSYAAMTCEVGQWGWEGGGVKSKDRLVGVGVSNLYQTIRTIWT